MSFYLFIKVKPIPLRQSKKGAKLNRISKKDALKARSPLI
jgi:hypothetical protein